MPRKSTKVHQRVAWVEGSRRDRKGGKEKSYIKLLQWILNRKMWLIEVTLLTSCQFLKFLLFYSPNRGVIKGDNQPNKRIKNIVTPFSFLSISLLLFASLPPSALHLMWNTQGVFVSKKMLAILLVKSRKKEYNLWQGCIMRRAGILISLKNPRDTG